MGRQFHRRGLLRRIGAASLGVAGLGGRVAAQEGDGQDGDTDGIEYIRMVVPSVDMLEPDFANRVVYVAETNQPGFRPPDVCFPEVPERADGQWFSHDATVIDPTETGGLFDDDPNSIGGFEDTAAFLGERVPERSLYRIVGGEPCDDGEFFQIQTHELTADLYDFFDIATEIIDGEEEDGANRAA